MASLLAVKILARWKDSHGSTKSVALLGNSNMPPMPKFPRIVYKMMCLALSVTLITTLWTSSFMMSGRCTPELVDLDRHNSLVTLLHKWAVTAEGFWGHLLQSISVVKFVAS